MNDILYLVSKTISTDELGDQVVSEASRMVFCEVESIGQSEFYQAQASGLKPEIKFKIADYLDYKNEKDVIYNNERYHVLRTYRNGIELELTCYQEVNNGAS